MRITLKGRTQNLSALWIVFLGILISHAGCAALTTPKAENLLAKVRAHPPSLTPTLTLLQSETPQPSPTPWPTPTPIRPDSGWSPVQVGLERREINLLDENGQLVERLYLLRIDPQAYEFRVAYQEHPLSLADWQALTQAAVLINGGYFRVEGDQYIPTGLTIVDGEAIGSSYGDFAGMLAISAAGPELRWMALQPYAPGEALHSGLQSFPLLIKPGGEMGFPAEYEDYQAARRTVIGMDREGFILLMVAARGSFSLHQMSRYLAESDLNLDIALNLDGGPSSGILLAEPYEIIPAFSPLPVVIAVFKR